MWFWLNYICESSVVHECCCVNCSTRVGNLEAVGLLKSIRNTSTIVWQPGSDRPCLVHISGGPCAQLGGQAKKAQISSWDFAWNRHSLFNCAQDNSPRSPAQMIQTTSCSAVVWSQSHLSSHSLIYKTTEAGVFSAKRGGLFFGSPCGFKHSVYALLLRLLASATWPHPISQLACIFLDFSGLPAVELQKQLYLLSVSLFMCIICFMLGKMLSMEGTLMHFHWNYSSLLYHFWVMQLWLSEYRVFW